MHANHTTIVWWKYNTCTQHVQTGRMLGQAFTSCCISYCNTIGVVHVHVVCITATHDRLSCRPSHLMHNPWPTWVAKEGEWLPLRTLSWAHGSCSPSYGESLGTRKYHHVCSLLVQNWSNLNIWTWLHLRNYMTHWKIEAVQRIRTQRHLQNDVRYIHRHIHVGKAIWPAWGLPRLATMYMM